MWARVAFAFALVLGVACAGKSTSSSDDGSSAGDGSGGSSGASSGGTVTGGSAGTAAGGSAGTTIGGSAGTSSGGSATGGVSGDENCNDERRAMRNYVNQFKACVESIDCTTLFVGCGITEDGCTGAVYLSRAAPPELFTYNQLRLEGCLADYEGTFGCAQCDRVALPPTCSNGRCIGSSACALEANAVWDFKARNDACQVDDDCVLEVFGCEVTEDDCTGAVYFAADVDRAELNVLRSEYSTCTGGCVTCEREVRPPACVSGHCAARPLR